MRAAGKSPFRFGSFTTMGEFLCGDRAEYYWYE